MRTMRTTTALLAMAALTVGLLAGCQTANPVGSAERPETVALALTGSYTIVAEAAAAIVTNPATPPEVKASLKAVDAAAYPVVKQLQPLAAEVAHIRADLATGATTDEKLLVATTKLNDWITRAAPLIQNLTDAVRGAKR